MLHWYPEINLVSVEFILSTSDSVEWIYNFYYFKPTDALLPVEVTGIDITDGAIK